MAIKSAQLVTTESFNIFDNKRDAKDALNWAGDETAIDLQELATKSILEKWPMQDAELLLHGKYEAVIELSSIYYCKYNFF